VKALFVDDEPNVEFLAKLGVQDRIEERREPAHVPTAS
jgi:hypothetical protein